MFLLKPVAEFKTSCDILDLHSTMFLLKLFYSYCTVSILFTFTFHNVSIKTPSALSQFFFCPDLHSTMFLLKRFSLDKKIIPWFHLHSTMFLLKHASLPFPHLRRLHLHSTMFLLKHEGTSADGGYTVHLHSTMFLLKLADRDEISASPWEFTFHNVSIKTQRRPRRSRQKRLIYIPQCFY